MSKVIMFSQTYPSYHPRAGEETFFIEKITKGFLLLGIPTLEFDELRYWDYGMYEECDPKYHTIRAGYHFKVGDLFSPRVWSGRPYNSQQITIAPDIQIKKVWDIEIDTADIWAIGLPDTQIKYLDDDLQARIALNDGLSEQDLYFWFKMAKKPWTGQIICWNESIEY